MASRAVRVIKGLRELDYKDRKVTSAVTGSRVCKDLGSREPKEILVFRATLEHKAIKAK